MLIKLKNGLPKLGRAWRYGALGEPKDLGGFNFDELGINSPFIIAPVGSPSTTKDKLHCIISIIPTIIKAYFI